MKARGLAIVIVGSSLATVMGVPLSTVVGQHFGWPGSLFAYWRCGRLHCLYTLASASAACRQRYRLISKAFPACFATKELALLYLQTLLAVTGYFLAYTYLAPLLIQIGGFSGQAVPLFLLLMGLSGICGSLFATRLAAMKTKLVFILPSVAIFLCLLALNISIAHLRPSCPYASSGGEAWLCLGFCFRARFLK